MALLRPVGVSAVFAVEVVRHHGAAGEDASSCRCALVAAAAGRIAEETAQHRADDHAGQIDVGLALAIEGISVGVVLAIVARANVRHGRPD